MLKKKYLITFIMLIFIISCGENDSSSTEPEEINVDYSEEIAKIFPVNIGNEFQYSVDTLNHNSNNYESIGSRLLSIDNKVSDSELGYYVCSENYELNGKIIQAQSKFKFTENSIEFYSDTTGVSELVPDSLRSDVMLEMTETFKIVNFPYTNKEEWPAYKGTANFGGLKYNIFTVTGMYVDSETLQLDAFQSPLETEKFKYLVSLNIPDIKNPFLSNIQEYVVNIWFSPEVGIVKLEGCGLLIKPMTGGYFNLADSNSVVRHVLTSSN